MFFNAKVLNDNNEILRKNMRRKYEIWDLNTKQIYGKSSSKNAIKKDKDNLNFIQSEEFNDEFENAKLRRLLIAFAVIAFLVGLFVSS